MFCKKCGKLVYTIFSVTKSADDEYPYQRNIRCAECGALLESVNLIAL